MNQALPRRTLGREGPSVSAIGLGCMGMSDFYGSADDATNLAVLNHALDIGVNFLDTADMYGVGRNERLLGEVLRTRRDEIVLATKFGNVRAPNGDFLGVNGRPEYVASACDASLKRLGVDHIDLYYQHRVDPHVPIEETVGAMAKLGDDSAAEETDASPGRKGGGMVAVRVLNAEAERIAIHTLREHGAVDVERAEGEWRDGTWHDFDPLRPPQKVQ